MDTVTSADGTAIAYERTGEGPPLVLLHGTSRDRSHWARSLPGLARHTTVYAVNRRGRGESGDADRYAIEREVEDVLAVIDAVGEPVHLLGHSYGAIIALEVAMRTDRLRGLILYEPPIAVGADRVPDDLGERLAAFLQEGPRYPPEVIAARRALPTWPDALALAHTLPRETQTVHRYALDPARVAAVKASTLLLLGSQSPSFFRAAIEALHATLPQSEMVVLPGQHHNAMEAAPELFVETVHRFVGEQRDGEGR